MDSCASYHTFFVKEFLKNIQEGGATMTGRCNTDTTRTSKRGSYGDFKVWLNKKGIANLISIPMLEASGYIVSTHTKGEWKVVTPGGILFLSSATRGYVLECHTSTFANTSRDL